MSDLPSCKPKPEGTHLIIAIPGLCPHCGGEVEVEMLTCPNCNHPLSTADRQTMRDTAE